MLTEEELHTLNDKALLENTKKCILKIILDEGCFLRTQCNYSTVFTCAFVDTTNYKEIQSIFATITLVSHNTID